ncbi:adenosylhomocysteinase [Candidatus Woesearchaeota archaeon]|nr:adenosylhomocysteinase [Candidatus Woesearchaeota archaeon]
MKYKVKDMHLAEQGRLNIELAESRMPVLRYLRKKYDDEKPLKGISIGGCLHVTKETAVLIRTLKAAGAEVAWSGCNPLSTQDDVAAALVKYYEVPVFAWRGLSNREYYDCIDEVLDSFPDITMDDGADLIIRIHKNYCSLLKKVFGGTEETTTGVHRLRAMAAAGKLRYPVVAVNDAETKWDFDNVYGTGQSTLDGIIRSTNVLLAGKTVVVAGYGHCGKGVAMRARGMGANVIVTEVDPMQALKATMDGYRVMPMDGAAPIGDVFVTATGCRDVIKRRHLRKMKDGTVLSNTGHFNVEISLHDLKDLAEEKKEVRPNMMEYLLCSGKKLYLLAEGRLVNLAAAEGHPSEVMDMSFANQFLSVLYLVQNKGGLNNGVHDVSREQDAEVAAIKLNTLGVGIDVLTREQQRYLKDYTSGT